MHFRERSRELERVSRVFLREFPSTASRIRQLSEDFLLPKATVDKILEDWKDTAQTFKNEFIGSNENWKYRGRCYVALEKTIIDMIKEKGVQASRKTFENILPALQAGNQALNNLNEIALTLVAPQSLSEKSRYYGLCFMYLVLIEGLYDENIRILYIFRKTTKGADIDYEAIREKDLWSFKSELGPVFFEGYNNRIRNAIAHAKFRLDDAKSRMIFQDRATKCQPEYNEELSFRQFGIKYYGKIDSFCRLRTFYLFLLGVRDLIFASKPFGN